MSPLLRLYLAFSQVSGPIWRLSHRRRLQKGKELPERLPEKYGRYQAPRPPGEVLWFHALSVGESLALLPLIERCLTERSDASVVLTTSTATSAEAISRIGLPDRSLHVLLPIDTPRATRAFLDHWRPCIAVFAELDFWPRLIVETKRRDIPMILVNSRMSAKSLKSRQKLGGMMGDILAFFDKMLLQDEGSLDRFKALGADPSRLSVVGPLKAAARPLPADEAEVDSVRAAIGDRFVWLAAATRYVEDISIIEAHALLRRNVPDALLIIAPRHVAAGDDIESIALERFATVSRRSVGNGLDASCDVYIADTIGEMGLWYRVAPVSFIGHSLEIETEFLTGKNPYEAAALGSVILYGPMVSDFEESYESLHSAGAARKVTDAATLAEALVEFSDASARESFLDGAKKVIADRRAILENTWTVIDRALSR